MAIPTYDKFIEPVLRVLAEHPDGLRSSLVYEAVANRVQLSVAERDQLLPSGKQPTYKNRIGWAHDRLKRAGLTTALSRGTWALTSKGRDFVASHNGPLTDEQVEGLADVPADSSVKGSVSEMAHMTSQAASEKQPPDERIDLAVAELEAAVRRDVLELVRRSPPVFFERLILELLLKMGYGASADNLERTGQSGDGGIDGVISLDRLGLDKVYLQAKRWSADNTVGRPEIQAFVGALAGRRASRGVFITTASFSGGAHEYAKQVSDSLVLVDGQRLADLMIEFEIGVAVERVVKIPRVDLDYFEDA